jgi:hypothetical protein
MFWFSCMLRLWHSCALPRFVVSSGSLVNSFGIPRTPTFSFVMLDRNSWIKLHSGKALASSSSASGTLAVFACIVLCRPWHSCDLCSTVSYHPVSTGSRIIWFTPVGTLQINLLRSLHRCLPVSCHAYWLHLLLRLSLCRLL